MANATMVPSWTPEPLLHKSCQPAGFVAMDPSKFRAEQSSAVLRKFLERQNQGLRPCVFLFENANGNRLQADQLENPAIRKHMVRQLAAFTDAAKAIRTVLRLEAPWVKGDDCDKGRVTLTPRHDAALTRRQCCDEVMLAVGLPVRVHGRDVLVIGSW